MASHNAKTTGPPWQAVALAMLEAGDFGMAVIDARGVVALWNGWFAARTALPSYRAVGKHCRELPLEISEWTIAACEEVIRTGQPRFLTADNRGVLMPLLGSTYQTVRIFPVLDDQGGVVGAVS